MYIADLHIHSKYSRATSRDCDAPHLDLWARQKGIDLVGTGDFTHPQWRAELTQMLERAEAGLYRLRDEYQLPCRVAGTARRPRFVVSGEISTIYKKNGRTRKVHHVILLPGLEAAEALAQRLEAIGNLKSDGRPILGLDSHDLLAIVLDVCPDAIYIPAHIWTPHFSLFGAFSGFDSLEECYEDLAGEVHALETGLSSDPPMNRRLSTLDGYQLISNSDAHSPAKLGREANLLTCEMSYPALRRAINTGDGLYGTIEFFPEEGKYHLDGHRACDVCLEPWETARLGGKCPVCGRKLTVGVLSRVEAMADRSEPVRLERPFESLMPLNELLGDCLGAAPAGKKVQAAYLKLLERLGSEFDILRQASLADVEKAAGAAVAEGLRRLRAGKVRRRPGFDGEYGVISLLESGERQRLGGQTALFEPPAAAPAVRAKPELAPAPAPQTEKRDPAQAAQALNPAQQQAVKADGPVVAVIAGPGTGKTKTLVSRIAYLIEERGISPSHITALTFTRQAAGEMRDRLTERLGKRALKGLTIGTFHGVCLQLIQDKPLVGGVQAVKVMQRALMALDRKDSPLKCQKQVSALKNGALSGDDALWALRQAYDQELAAMGARDLDDILLEALAVDLGAKRQFEHLLVDEFQDINPLQHQLVEHFSRQGKSLFVIGDPDQSIYGFRGADADCFQRLLALHPQAQAIALDQNYRSSPQVLSSALALIRHNPGRDRRLTPNCPAGAPVRLMAGADGFSEGVWIAGEIGRMVGGVGMLEARSEREGQGEVRAFSDIAVLCRTHRQLEGVEACLLHDSIPCMVMGGEDFLSDAKVQGLTGFFGALLDPRNGEALASALTALWGCQEALVGRAQRAMSGMEAPDKALLRDALGDCPGLAPWLDAVEDVLPRLKREKPRKLLETLLQHCGAGGRAVEKLKAASVFYERMEQMVQGLTLGGEADVRRLSGSGVASGAVRLMTLHAAKGLEFPVVFLAGLTGESVPFQREGQGFDVEEERRLLFVGMTRAREELILTWGGQPSPFLNELSGDEARGTVPRRRRAPQAQQLSMF